MMTGNVWDRLEKFQAVTLMMSGIPDTGWKKWSRNSTMMTTMVLMVVMAVLTVVTVALMVAMVALTVLLQVMALARATVLLQAMVHLQATVLLQVMHLSMLRSLHLRLNKRLSSNTHLSLSINENGGKSGCCLIYKFAKALKMRAFFMSMDGRYAARSQGGRCGDAMDGRYAAGSQGAREAVRRISIQELQAQ